MLDALMKIGGKVLDKVGVGNLLQFGGTLLGGERQEDMANAQMAEAQRQQGANLAAQREFAQMGIRWRAEDARAAGLHPLSVLGASGASYAPNPVVVGDSREDGLGKAISELGQNVTRSVAAQETADQRALRQAQLASAWAQAEESQARAWLAQTEAALNQQRMMHSGRMPGGAGSPVTLPTNLQFDPQNRDRIVSKPDEVISTRTGDRSVTAGQHAAWREYNVRPDSDIRVRLPYSEEGPGEAFENIPWYAWPWVLRENANYYGDGWLTEIFTGNPRKFRQASFTNRRDYLPESYYGGYNVYP